RVVWIIGLLFLIFASNKLVEFLADAAAGKLPADIIFNMLWLKMLAIQPKLLPITLFLAVLLAYARLARDNELAILATSGVGKTHQLKIVIRLTVLFCLVV
ncbi:MAG: LptF/LptG family permease, partial [Candidatus Dadabacteria bacterium]|nr:LptF/LptG family permease [Candidatus Dadabacteria bacterium]